MNLTVASHPKTRRGILALSALVILTMQVGSCRKSGSEHFTIAVPRTAWTWPLYIAMEAGYYEEYGVSVEFVFANHPAGIAMLASGQADANLMPLGRALEVGSLDDSFVAIPAPVGKWLFGLIAHEELGAADLRGGKVGVAQIGDSTYNYAVALLDRLGLTPGDVEWIVTGAEGRMPALVARRVDATMLSAPAYFRLEEHGFRDLANIIDYDDLHTPSVLLVRKEALLERPQLADALVKAHAEAVERFYADKEFAIAAHRVYDRQEIGDLGRVYDRYRERNLLERVPHIGEDAIRYVVETVPDTAVLSRLRAFDAASLIDNETLDRLVNSGFFDSLFGPEVLAR